MKSARCSRARRLVRAGVMLAFAGVAAAAHAADPAPAGLDGAAREAGAVASRFTKDVDHVTIAPLDVEALLREDAGRSADGLPPRYAVAHKAALDTDNAGTWGIAGRGMLRWQLRISSVGARSINLGFTGFELPEGASLQVYAADGSIPFRAFDVSDNEEHGQLWTPPVAGDELLLELTIPENEVQFLWLELGSINVGYRGFFSTVEGRDGVDRSGSCNLDVICGAADGYPQVDAWRDEIPGVAVISTGGSTFCTGFTVNNTAQDGTPYFMTANHCGIGAGNAPSLVAFWNYENSTCRPVGSGASGGSGNGTLTQFNTGSIFRASYSPSDMTLVELDDPINPAYEVSLLGWNRSGANATSAVAIHHPSTDEKRWSIENAATTTTSYLGTSVPGDGTHERVIDWDIGTTEPGSSGSPLFNQNNQVIGQLHGGYAACGNNDSDWYGKFSVSWNGGGTNSTRLSNWLDPGNTGATFVNTISGAGMQVDPATGVAHQGPVGGPFTNGSVDYTLSNGGGSAVNYTVTLDPGGTAPLLIDGGSSASGSISGGGGSTMVTVSLDASAAALLGVGTYSTDVVFDDTTNGRQLVRTHTVEVGLTEIAISPTDDLFGSGPTGGPFGPTRVYTVTSTQPNPVDVEVSASNSWISLNGSTGTLTFTLTGLGDSEDVIVGYSNIANTLGAGYYTGSVSFANTTSGDGNDSVNVYLDAGRVAITSTDTPVPITDNNSFQSEIFVPQDVEIGDVNIKVNISHTYIGDLIVEVMSPLGTVVRLHNRTGGSADDLITTYDDGTNAPDGPGLLADFNGESAQGTWTLLGSDNAGIDEGALNSWTLLIGAATLPPPDCVGDLDGDEDTDVLDFTIFATYFGTSVAPNTNGDMNGDGFVDVTDFSAFSSNFGCPN